MLVLLEGKGIVNNVNILCIASFQEFRFMLVKYIGVAAI